VLALARGTQIHFVKSADAYADGASETMFGKLIKKNCVAWVRATMVNQKDGIQRYAFGDQRIQFVTHLDVYEDAVDAIFGCPLGLFP